MSDPLEPVAGVPAGTTESAAPVAEAAALPAESAPAGDNPLPPADNATPPAVTSVDFKFTFLYIFGDTLVRYLLLVAKNYGFLPGKWFWILQIFVLPWAMTALLEKRKDKIRAEFGLSKDTIVSAYVSPVWTVILSVIFLTDIYHFNLFPAWGVWGKIFLLGPLLFMFFGYYLGLVFGSMKAEKYLPEAEIDQPYDPDDENDRSLTRLQSQIASLERKVDSYTVESTLIGALAFSSFVTIASSDKVTIQDVYTFLRSCTVAQGIHFFRARQNLLAPVGTEKTLLIVIAMSAILCSMFFIAVIVARLRFNDLIGETKYFSEMAAKFNEKEDALAAQILSQTTDVLPAQTDRLAMLGHQIDVHLMGGFTSLERVKPNMAYMGAFRTFGIFSFIAALIASATWVSPALAAVFTLIGLVAAMYPRLDQWIRGGTRQVERLTGGALPGANLVKRLSKKG
jgi:hypothetical protein